MAALMKFDTLSWAKKLEKAGVPPKQAEVQVELIFKAINDNICTKQDLRESEGNITIKLKELELKIEQVKTDLSLSIEQVKTDLSLSIEQVKTDLVLSIEKVNSSIEQVKSDLVLSVEKVNGSLEKVKGSVHKQIARWVLGVSAIQATLIIGVIRYLH